MKRRLLNLVATLSLALFVVTAWLWSTSYDRWRGIDWYRGNHVLQWRSAMGAATFQRGQDADDEHPLWGFRSWSRPKPPPMDWSKVPPDAVGVITEDMVFYDRFWWWPEERFRCMGLVIYRPEKSTSRYDLPARPGCWAVTTPYWMWLTVSAFLPTSWFIQRARQQSRFRRGRCIRCGYDLRATRDRCPECGDPVKIN